MTLRSVLPTSFATAVLTLCGATMGLVSAQDAAPDSVPVAEQAGGDANPIDLSITTQRPVHFRRGVVAHAINKAKVARVAGAPAGHHRNLLPNSQIGTVRNTLGQVVGPEIAAVKGPAQQPAAVGAASQVTANHPASSGVGSARAAARQQGFVPLHPNTVAPHGSRIAVASRSAISGRDMIRPGVGSGTIGGPAKTTVGVITGAGFRPSSP